MNTSSLRRLCYVALLSGSFVCFAQNSDLEKAFWERAKSHMDSFEKTTQSHFEKMRSNFNAEYAEALNGIWKEYTVSTPTVPPLRPEPKKQPVAPAPTLDPPSPIFVIPDKIVPPPLKIQPVPLQIPKEPVVTLPESEPKVTFDFFGAPCQIGKYDFQPIAYDAKAMRLGDQYQQMESSKGSQALVDDCIRLREALSLCDMGYLWLCEDIANTIYPGDHDSQAFLTSYILNQSGYDVKLGLTTEGLTLLMNTDLPISGYYSLTIDGKRYYIRDPKFNLHTIRTYDGMYAAGESIPIRMVPDRMPTLDPKREQTVNYSSKLWSIEPEFQVTVSRPEMEFFKGYPWMSWEHYFRAPVSENFRSQVIDTMRNRVKGLSTFDGVRKLLSFVQFGFNYMTDAEQYQHEKVNFPEENFYYPANDCEDRAILFATLIREIYGLDVVLLHYEKHLSTAVDFGDPTIQGDAMNIDGHHYVMCDPTFIGARIGMSMPMYRGIKPEVYRR